MHIYILVYTNMHMYICMPMGHTCTVQRISTFLSSICVFRRVLQRSRKYSEVNRYQVLYYLEGFITFCVINHSEIQYLHLLIFKAFLTKTKSFQNLCTASLKCCYSMINAQSQIKICNIATNGKSAVGRVAALVSSDSIYKERFYI